MSDSESIEALFAGASVLRSKDLEERGFSRTAIREAVAAGRMDRVGRGLYALPGADIGAHHSLVVVARRVPQAVICLLSALEFHELTTQVSHEVWIAIGPKDRKPEFEHPPLRVLRYGLAHAALGVEEHEVEGATLRIYSVARTVVDLFRYRNKVGIDVALEALREGWRDRRFTLAELNRIARVCRMGRVMKPYLEALTA
ncbi:AbiEi antitoxin N-terminal domain-containing protein [Haloferula sp. A504]|uniref:type IV toxin-antitoxin system AbiEi family antitoxin domain-containing protein n=1 Tax=Haloferula sp. A504 TaxID=3373601 RepID=UPI0031C604FC|nr:AbiEi antitoxin N-terminal domain-containing protein [Verrucomicrobiaceae bacterium E54]